MSLDVRKVKLDFNRQYQGTIPSVQGDTGRAIEFQIMNGSLAVDITGEQIKIFGKKPDGFRVFNNATITDATNGKCTVDLTEQMLCVAGTVQCTLVRYKDGLRLSSKKFNITVSETVADDIDAESTNEYLALTDALSITKDNINSAVDTVIQQMLTDGDLANMTIANNSITAEKTAFFDASINLFNVSTVDENKFISTGNLSNNTNYNTSALIPVNVGDVLYFSNDGEPVQVRNICNWTLAGNYSAGIDASNVISYTIPDNVGSIRVSYSVNYTKFQVEKDGVTSYKEYGGLLKEDLLPKTVVKKEEFNNSISELENKISDIDVTELSSNLFDISTVNYNKYISSGNLVANTNYNTSALIPVNVGDILYFSNNGEPVQVRTIAKWSKAGNYQTGCETNQVVNYTVENNIGSIMISYDKNYDKFQVEKDKITSYKEYGKNYIKSEMIDLGNTVQEIEKTLADEPIVYMPDEICVAVGRTIEIYNNQICINANRFHFRWFCNVGKPLERKFQVTGLSANVGEYALTLTLYDDNMNQVYKGTTTLKIVAELTTAKTNLQIGDSLTNTTSTPKPTFNEMRTLSNNKLSFVGTRGTTEGEKHEGRSGWTSGDYLTNKSYTYESEGVNPFYNPASSRFDWSYYKTQTGLNPDSVTIFLGTNGLSFDPTSNANNIKQIVDYIRQDDNTLPIFVVNTIYKSNQDGIGTMMNGADGFATNRGMMKYEEDLKTIKLALKLQELFKNYENLYLIPLNLLHDNEYNFGQKEVTVNPRSTIKEIVPTDGVHPSDGYLQFADVQYSSYCCHLI